MAKLAAASVAALVAVAALVQEVRSKETLVMVAMAAAKAVAATAVAARVSAAAKMGVVTAQTGVALEELPAQAEALVAETMAPLQAQGAGS